MLNQFATSSHVQKQTDPPFSSKNGADPMRNSISGLASLQTYQTAPPNQKNIDTRILNRPNFANISITDVTDTPNFNNGDYYIKTSGNQGMTTREANFSKQDIEEVTDDRTNDRCSINTIPISPIGFKQF